MSCINSKNDLKIILIKAESLAVMGLQDNFGKSRGNHGILMSITLYLFYIQNPEKMKNLKRKENEIEPVKTIRPQKQ